MLDGKVAIVTGAGRGIGRGEALLLAREGAKVVVNDLGGAWDGQGNDERPAQQVVDEIIAAGGEAVANYASVSDFEAAGGLVAQAVATFGRLDILVNNAGILRDKMIFNMDPEDFDAVAGSASSRSLRHDATRQLILARAGEGRGSRRRAHHQHFVGVGRFRERRPSQLRGSQGRDRGDDRGRGPGAPPLWRDRQVRGFLALVLFFSLLLTLVNVLGRERDIVSALAASFFNVVSVVTTTGYASEDYSLWGGLGVMVFFYLTFVGGCSGSTAGGLKIFRFQVAYILLRHQLRRLVHPHAIFTERYNDREIGEDILRSLISFSFFFALTIGLLALALSAVGLDFMTSLTGAATAVTNVGPGLGATIGPAGNFASLPDGAKWLLGIGMLLGRLEIMTVLVLLTPAFWRG